MPDVIKDKLMKVTVQAKVITIEIECDSNYEARVMFDHFKDTIENGGTIKLGQVGKNGKS